VDVGAWFLIKSVDFENKNWKMRGRLRGMVLDKVEGAVNGMRNRSQWYAVFMICVFLPMYLFASLHVHEYEPDASDDCYYCIHHLPHSGHLSASPSCGSECLLCHFLTLPYIPAVALVFGLAEVFSGENVRLPEALAVDSASGLVSLRAPPFIY